MTGGIPSSIWEGPHRETGLAAFIRDEVVGIRESEPETTPAGTDLAGQIRDAAKAKRK
jgi:hypothetical protein